MYVYIRSEMSGSSHLNSGSCVDRGHYTRSDWPMQLADIGVMTETSLDPLKESCGTRLLLLLFRERFHGERLDFFFSFGARQFFSQPDFMFWATGSSSGQGNHGQYWGKGRIDSMWLPVLSTSSPSASCCGPG